MVSHQVNIEVCLTKEIYPNIIKHKFRACNFYTLSLNDSLFL